MAEAKDKMWVFPFIGAILVGISLFTPAAQHLYGLGSSFIWMTGFMLLAGGAGPYTGFFADPIGGEVILGVIIP